MAGGYFPFTYENPFLLIRADKEALLGREITKDGKTLVLRNAQGIPQWSRGPRRGN
jgi:hypothetical protein